MKRMFFLDEMILIRFFMLLIVSSIILHLDAQTKRALVIGLGQQEDIIFVTEMLRRVGYGKRNVITLVNEKATKQRIVSSFKELAKLCKYGDIVYVHFSGHGQRVTDVNGDEGDGWDESWIPYDAYRKYCIKDKGDKHLIDDELYQLLTDIKTKIGEKGRMLVVVDACHGGDSSCGLTTLVDQNEKQELGVEITTRGVSDPFVLPNRKKTRNIKGKEQWLTLSACKSFQANQELNNPQVGILSYALYIISKLENVKMEKIEEFVKVNKGVYPQTPMLTGETDKYKISDILK